MPTDIIEALTKIPPSPTLFNPYVAPLPDVDLPDARDEVTAAAARLRSSNLLRYLEWHRSAGTTTLLVGEALSYNGGRFTGLAFTSEFDVQQGHTPLHGLELLPAVHAGHRRRMREPSGGIVWREIAQAKSPPILFNAVQAHPHEPGRALTNRRPTTTELQFGAVALKRLVEKMGIRKIASVGRTAQKLLADMGYESTYLRHPAYGGKAAFVGGLGDFLGRSR